MEFEFQYIVYIESPNMVSGSHMTSSREETVKYYKKIMRYGVSLPNSQVRTRKCPPKTFVVNIAVISPATPASPELDAALAAEAIEIDKALGFVRVE